jgi:hypothetical protein
MPGVPQKGSVPLVMLHASIYSKVGIPSRVKAKIISAISSSDVRHVRLVKIALKGGSSISNGIKTTIGGFDGRQSLDIFHIRGHRCNE